MFGFTKHSACAFDPGFLVSQMQVSWIQHMVCCVDFDLAVNRRAIEGEVLRELEVFLRASHCRLWSTLICLV